LEREREEVRAGEKAMIAGGGGTSAGAEIRQSLHRGGVGGSEASQWSMERQRRNEKEWSECLRVSGGERQ